MAGSTDGRSNPREDEKLWPRRAQLDVEANAERCAAAWLSLGNPKQFLGTNRKAVYFGRDCDEGVISGDLMHSPLQARYPDLSIVFDVDPAQAAVTRRKFLERYCDTSILCCPVHFPSPSWGRVKRWGDGFRFEPVGA